MKISMAVLLCVFLSGSCISSPMEFTERGQTGATIYQPKFTYSLKSWLLHEPAFAAIGGAPLTIRFDISSSIEFCNSSEGGSAKKITFPLRELEYTLIDDDGNAFFEERIDLFGQEGSGYLLLSPGIQYPLNSSSVTVQSAVRYDEPIIDHNCNPVDYKQSYLYNSTSSEVADFGFGHRDMRYREGLKRRHILGLNRLTTSLWLKEYEPGKDRKELLYHSLTEKVLLDSSIDDVDRYQKTRIYIPWLERCTNRRHGCGSSVEDDAVSAFTEGENPLLHGGLAMAYFAIEYKTSGHLESLNYAIKLFDYIKASEWYEASVPTGFFIRSRGPGETHESVGTCSVHEANARKKCKEIGGVWEGREVFFASVDEMLGMLLGLYHLKTALENSPESSPYINAKNELVALSGRIATQLKGNYYFILPLIRASNGSYRSIYGLPKEIHNGWNASYLYQWYIAGILKKIVGYGQAPPSSNLGAVVNTEFWKAVKSLERQGESDDRPVSLALLLARKTPLERAILAIKFTGLYSYYAKEGIDIILPIKGTVNFNPLDYHRYNIVMMLHAFQLGAESGRGDEDFRKELYSEMSKLLAGILKSGGSSTKFSLSDLQFLAFFTGNPIELAVISALDAAGLFDISLKIGSEGEDEDYYAAALMYSYRLYEAYPSRSERQSLYDLSRNVIDRMTSYGVPIADAGNGIFPPRSPVGERGVPGAKVLTHNPKRYVGSTFSWEHGVKTIMNGGNPNSMSLDDEELKYISNQSPFIDTLVEGVGLDYLYPNAIIKYKSGKTDFNRGNLKVYDYRSTPDLKACSVHPRIAERQWAGWSLDGVSDKKCTYSLYKLPYFDSLENRYEERASSLTTYATNEINFSYSTDEGYIGRKGAWYDWLGRKKYEIPVTENYQYYSIENHDKVNLRVRIVPLEGSSLSSIVFVADGKVYPSSIMGGVNKGVYMINGRDKHLIRLSSRVPAKYQLIITHF